MTRRFVDLSHPIVDGMTTHPGIAPPRISTVLSFEESAGRYAPGTEFEIVKIEMVANTGTYLDTPAHRYRGGSDIAAVDIADVADLPAIVVDCRWATDAAAEPGRGIGPETFDRMDPEGRAVLLWTGWDRHWGAPAYLADNPFLTTEGAQMLVERGAALIGIDSLNIDSLADPRRPAHTAILAAGIPLVEHLTGLGELPREGSRFFAVPAPIRGMGTFPGRAFAIVDS
jgi:kynurenine formamidase